MSHDLGARVAQLEKGQEAIFGKLDDQGNKIGTVLTMITEMRASKGPSLRDGLTIAMQVGTFASLLIYGIIYLAKNTYGPENFSLERRATVELHQLDKRVMALELRSTWTAEVRRAP